MAKKPVKAKSRAKVGSAKKSLFKFTARSALVSLAGIMAFSVLAGIGWEKWQEHQLKANASWSSSFAMYGTNVVYGKLCVYRSGTRFVMRGYVLNRSSSWSRATTFYGMGYLNGVYKAGVYVTLGSTAPGANSGIFTGGASAQSVSQGGVSFVLNGYGISIPYC